MRKRINDLLECKSTRELKDLLNNGYPVDMETGNGETALFSANLEFSKVLIDFGANVNHQNDGSETPIFFSDIEKTKLLVEKSADLTLTNIEGQTPLDYSIAKEDENKSIFLIKKGITIDSIDLSGFSTRESANKNLIKIHDDIKNKRIKTRKP